MQSPKLPFLLVGLMIVASIGCSRAHYRRQADQEAYQFLEEFSRDPRWPLENYVIQPPVGSRMFDPGDPDCPPMPPDDPTAHQFMHCVDCKKGWPCWRCYGQTPFVENPYWRAYLPLDNDGNLVLDRQAAVQTALLHSRDYQFQLENLYLSALDVSFERFRFDVQFFAGNSTFFETVGRIRGGGRSRSTLTSITDLQARKLLATGGELVVGLANTLVWQFSGPDRFTANSVLDFSLVQPLLRGGGRAIALENLTDAERALLSNVRQMERYRRGFYTLVVAGRNPGPGPAPGNLGFGAFAPGGGGAAGGFLSLLEDQIRIRNQRQNVAGLQSSLNQLEAFYEAGRIDRFQVDLARQSLYNAQSGLLSVGNTYQDQLDAYKIVLGLPPDLEIRIADPLLERFDLIAPSLAATQETLALLIQAIGDLANPLTDEHLQQMAALPRQVFEHVDLVARDRERLAEALPERRKTLLRLADREEIRSGEMEQSLVDVAALDSRVARVGEEFVSLQSKLQATLDQLQQSIPRPGEPPAGDPLAQREALSILLRQLSGQVRELSLIQAATRIDAVTLVPVDLEPEKALKIASLHRLDWMNARAALVDQWRQIEIAANALRSDLNLTFSGDIATTDNNPVRFRAANGRLRVGAEFDAPLTRLVERNAYRATLINYQRVQREYYEFVDLVSQVLRRNLRTLRLSQLDFELRRAGVFVAISQVESAQARLDQPPKPGATTTLGATTARDLVQALDSLLRAQNNFLSLWVDYEAQRMFLDFDLGTMQLDRNGMWIDPGPIGATDADLLNQPEEIPPGILELPPPPLPE
jgi:hypothetical protein